MIPVEHPNLVTLIRITESNAVLKGVTILGTLDEYLVEHDAAVRANERSLMEDRDQRFAHCEHCPEGCDEEHQIACNWNAVPVCREGARRLT